MKSLRLAMMISGGLVAATGFLIACSSDDTVIVPNDGGMDGGADQSAPDTSTPPDSGTDAPVFPDAGLTLETYPAQLAQVLCRNLARCCYGDGTLDGGAAVDGGTYDQQGCIDFYTAVGFEGASDEWPSTTANLTLNNAKGDECVAKLDALVCDTPGAMYTAVAQACFGAIVGKLAAGQPCAKTLECAPGNFCMNGDGGTGVCTALRPTDGNCGDWFATDDPANNAQYAEQACSYRGRGVDTGRYCDFYDFVAGEFRPQAEWKCKTAGGVGANCASTPWCKDSLCDDLNTATCVASREFFAPTPPGAIAGCGKFVKP